MLLDKQQQTLFYQIAVDEDTFDKNNNEIAASASASASSSGPSIAKIFRLIESNKEALNIETYSLSQTTLEQVFLSFARKQFDPNETTKSTKTTTSSRYAANRVGGGTSNRGFHDDDLNNDPATVVFKELNV